MPAPIGSNTLVPDTIVLAKLFVGVFFTLHVGRRVDVLIIGAGKGEDGERRGILLSGADDEEEPEEEEEEDAAATTNGRSAASAAATAAAAAATADHPYGLIGAIITPSPFDHHNSSDRYRSALARVQSSPLTDVEAWGAILTEASTSYRSLVPHLHYLGGGSLAAGVVPPPGVGSPSELEAKLDWVESCHGALLRHFPYAAAYAVSMAEILMGQTSLQGEEGAVALAIGRCRTFPSTLSTTSLHAS